MIAGGVAGFTVGLVLDTAGDRDRLYSLIGLAVFLLFGWIFSKHPSQVKLELPIVARIKSNKKFHLV